MNAAELYNGGTPGGVCMHTVDTQRTGMHTHTHADTHTPPHTPPPPHTHTHRYPAFSRLAYRVHNDIRDLLEGVRVDVLQRWTVVKRAGEVDQGAVVDCECKQKDGTHLQQSHGQQWAGKQTHQLQQCGTATATEKLRVQIQSGAKLRYAWWTFLTWLSLKAFKGFRRHW